MMIVTRMMGVFIRNQLITDRINKSTTMKKLSNQGFETIVVLLIIIVLGIIGGTGWLVWNMNQKTEQSLFNSTKSLNDPTTSDYKKQEDQLVTPKTKSEAYSWLLYKSPGKEYEINLPDGWTLSRYNNDTSLYADTAGSIVYSKGTLAKVTETSGGRDFSGVPFMLNYSKTSDLSVPNGTKQSTFVTDNQNLIIDKYYYLVTTDPAALGPPKGTKEYTYWVTKGDYTITVIHDVKPGETDETSIIEKALKTVSFL